MAFDPVRPELDTLRVAGSVQLDVRHGSSWLTDLADIGDRQQTREAYFGRSFSLIDMPAIDRGSWDGSARERRLLLPEYDTTTVVLPAPVPVSTPLAGLWWTCGGQR